MSPLLTTTTINVVKLFGQYANMMKTLNNVATEIFQGIVQVRHLVFVGNRQLCQFYANVVFSFFGMPLKTPTIRLTQAQKDLITGLEQNLSIKTSEDKVRIVCSS